MKYDFDQLIDRKNTNSLKWEFMSFMFGDQGENDLLPLWVADMDFESPKAVVDAIKKRAEHGIYGYSLNHEGYYDAVMGWMKRRHQWDIKREWIVNTPGIVPALSLSIQTFTNPGDKVIIQRPVYYPFTNMIVNNGRIVSNNSLIYKDNHYTMDFEDLEKKAKDPTAKVMILCSPHNPIGRVWTTEELKKVAEICLKNDVILLSDEIHGDLVYGNHKHHPVTSLSKEFEQNTIVCTAPSKTFNLAGLHTSNIIIANKGLRANFLRTSVDKNFNFDGNPFGIVATQAAYDHGEEWLEQILDYIKKNMDYIENFCIEKLPKVKFIKPEGTYLAWLDFTELQLSKEQLTDIIVKKGKIALDEGYLFGDEGIGFERINVACPRSIIVECMDRIEKVLREYLFI